MKRFLFYILLFLVSNSSYSKVILPSILGDHMVLQSNDSILLWGTALENHKVTVSVPWLKNKVVTSSDASGKWAVKLTTPGYGGPYDLRIKDSEELVVNDVYIGEVWLCSGQSNMQRQMRGAHSQPVECSLETIANLDESLPIRLFTPEEQLSATKLEDFKGSWETNTGDAVATFSAVGYFFAMQLYKSLKIPVGIINCSKGGSSIQAWMPEESVKKFPEIAAKYPLIKTSNYPWKDCRSLLYNGELYPLKNFKIKGFLWYQGETNVNEPEWYGKLLPVFVNDLRNLFNQPELPFYYVQIAPFAYSGSDNIEAAVFREVQMKCQSKINNSAMITLTDKGTEGNIHPHFKKEVGERLAYVALHRLYDKKAVSCYAPYLASVKYKDAVAYLTFKSDYEKEARKLVSGGITSFDKELKNFEIAGKDSVFYQAQAEINMKKSTVKVWSDKVKEPVAVRYAFKNFVVGDLFGANGLPVSSFRTDF